MSALDDPPTTTSTATTPCDTDKEPLLWLDGNYARIPGLLYEFAKWTVREALLQPWYQHRAVLVGRMTYVEDISTIPFMTGTIDDPIERTAQNPCPIGKTRVTEYNDYQDTLVDPKSGAPCGVHYTPPTTSDIVASGITVSKLQTAKEDGEDFKLLWKVFGNAECSDEIAEIAQGSGTKLRAELAKRHLESTTADQAVIDVEFTRVLSAGVGHELTASSLKAYIKAYKRARMGVLNPPAAGAEVQMISTIAFSDSTVNSLYEVKATVKPPKTLDAAVGILSGILTARVRSEELAQARDAAPRPALVATKPPTKPPPDAPPSPPSLMEMLVTQQQQLAALIAKQGVPDPRKTKAEKDKEKRAAKAAKAAADAAKKGKVVPPRDENNRVTHWIEGMDPCKECGGKHLHRDHAKHAGSTAGAGMLTMEEMQRQLDVLLAQQEQVANAAANGTGLVAQAIEPSESGESDESWCGTARDRATRLPTLATPPHATPARPRLSTPDAVVTGSACVVEVRGGPSAVTARGGPRGGASTCVRGSVVTPVRDPKLNAQPKPNAQPRSPLASSRYFDRLTGLYRRDAPTAVPRTNATRLEATPTLSDTAPPASSVPSGVGGRRQHARTIGSTRGEYGGKLNGLTYPPGLGYSCTDGIAALLPGVAVAVTPYLGQWLPDGQVGLRAGRTGLALYTPRGPSGRGPSGSGPRLSGPIKRDSLASALASAVLFGHVDSGCTGSMTPSKANLVNVRPCSEVFSAADKKTARAECIGDMPVIALDSNGSKVLLVFTNVRCVPSFGYTLLSVTQLWEEQRINALFADDRCLVLPSGQRIGYAAGFKLPTLRMVALPRLPVAGGGSSHGAWGRLLASSSASIARASAKPTLPALGLTTPAATPAAKGSLPAGSVGPSSISSKSARAVRRLETENSHHGSEHASGQSLPKATPSAIQSGQRASQPQTPQIGAPAHGAEAAGGKSGNHAAPSPQLLPTPRAGHTHDFSSTPASASSNSLAAGESHPDRVDPPFPEVAPTADTLSQTVIEGPERKATASASNRPLGWHQVGSVSHIAKLSAAQAAEILERRAHTTIDKIRALPYTTVDAPRVLASATAVPSCDGCALARIKRSKHASTLSAPAPEPGVMHVDLKEMVLSFQGYRWVVFFIDEYSRFVFYEFIKRKSDVVGAVRRAEAAFDATVGTRVDELGRPLPKPRFKWLHSDREGGLMSQAFREFRETARMHHTTSPPHDHDLNPIAERFIGLISETATAIRAHSNASARLWPWIIAYAVDWHNAEISSSVGSSPADANISAAQRFTLKPPRVMDLAAFGCRAVAFKAPNQQHKPSLSPRGWLGSFLGRSRDSKGCYDVLTHDNRVVSSSSVLVNEEYFDWRPKEKVHQPLTAKSHAASLPAPASLGGSATVSSNVSAPATFDKSARLHMLNLFSGPYARTDGLAPHLKSIGWARVTQIDNDGEKGGGWSHDILNDKTFATLLEQAKRGDFHALMIAFPCSTFAITRFFDASLSAGGDSGPPIIRDYDHPDGLPEEEIDPRHIRELRNSNKLLDRTVELAIAARNSPARTVIVVENPSDRSPGASIASAPEFSKHGSLFRTTAFKRLVDLAGLSGHATFAYCKLGSEYQKYTTLYYTPELSTVLDRLNDPAFKCDHEPGTHTKRAGGRGADGQFVSHAAAAYPARLNAILARAFAIARTGGEFIPQLPAAPSAASAAPPRAPPPMPDDSPFVPPTPSTSVPSSVGGSSPAPPTASVPRPATASPGGASPPPSGGSGSRLASSPMPFPDLGVSATAPRNVIIDHPGPKAITAAENPVRVDAMGRARRLPPSVPGSLREPGARRPALPRPPAAAWSEGGSVASPASPLETVHEHETPYSAGGTAGDGYSPFDAASTMEAAVAESAFDSLTAAAVSGASDAQLLPVSDWVDIQHVPSRSSSKRLPGGARCVPVEIALGEGDSVTPALLVQIGHALRADSPDAPSTHAEAVQRGPIWIGAEHGEIGNHKRNESWVTITRDELPKGRRVHKLIWVYKTKRDGTAKARLCVQGTTLESGIDYDQVFSAALRYSSARALFAYAARNGCKVRSVDLVAAYLQGRFVAGEEVYCHLPVGYPEYDSKGRPKLAKVQKPIYGIQQAGRRLQRDLFEWLREYRDGSQRFVQLDDSDGCIWKLECTNGEIVTIGVYVDNLQIVHSAELDADGRGPSGCAYNKFMDAFTSHWQVTDEGPMEDLLGIEVTYNDDGSIKLHQQKYIEKIVARFMPDGPLSKVQRNSLPYSKDFLRHVNDALSHDAEHPELTTELQSRVGCLMYAATSTRPDIAYAVHKLCSCLHKATPELLLETDHILSYLSRTASLGLTYTKEHMRLSGFADASWETATSTSGWFVRWQSAALSWGSRKQKSIALSTCEAEIIALSEATKDVVYLRKLVKGLDATEPDPTSLSTDSSSARDVSYNPQHHDRMKHVQRRHFFVRDMVESFEIEVPYVSTKDNAADIFTKPMSDANQFRRLRRIVMNERD